MEKLDKVIAALECCRVNEDEPCEVGCPYNGVEGCVDKVMLDALDLLKELRSTDGDLISRSALLTEIEENPWSIDIDELKAILEHVPTVEAEPVVHAHWIERAGGTHNICSNCHTGVPKIVSVERWQRCCMCGAYMDEEVVE